MVPRPRRLYDEWRRNYRLRSGLTGLVAALGGSLWLHLGPRQRGPGPGIEVVTFSVVPGLTRLWLRTLLPAFANVDAGVLVGDCSGGLASLVPQRERLRVRPVFNHVHGVKLDLFMRRLCRAPLVVICDDDIFWLSRRPLSWVLEKLASSPETAVVSLYPRGAPKPVLEGKVAQPMGSFCLAIRREVWIRECLSFRSYDPSDTADYHWTYDTADLAHVTLLERGYEVAIAPPGVRADLVALEGVSTWALKLQKHGGDMSRLLRTALRQRKAYRVFCFLKALPELAGSPEGLVAPGLLKRGLDWCKAQLHAEDVRRIDSEVAGLLSRLRTRIDSAAPDTEPRPSDERDVAQNG